MDELYTELLIKKKTKYPARTIKTIAIVIDALLVVFGFAMWRPLLIVFVVLLIFELVKFPKMEQEYEYLYVSGSLDIDLIYAKRKRKRICSYEFDQVEVIAPVGSYHLDNFKNGPLEDYTSGYPNRRDFEIVQTAGSHVRRIRIEVNDMIITDLKRRMPNKVFMD